MVTTRTIRVLTVLAAMQVAATTSAAQTPIPAADRPGVEAITLQASRLDAPLQIDGRLAEPLYELVQPMSEFTQNEPAYGTATTERTELWVSYDAEHVYISVRAHDSQPDQMIVNEMRRDNFNVIQNESFAFMLDTFHDRRSGVLFNFNAIGGRMDGQLVGEGNYNGDWNPIWDLAVGRFDGGWTAEAAVPFKSLAFQPERLQTWGFNARRIIRWKNEVSYVSNPPVGLGDFGITFPSFAGSLVGIEVPPTARTLDVKPYFISDLTSDVSTGISNELGADVGLDVRYALTRNISADFTYNTDFAQVEADEEQVNLTRFSLFFPEKREFFLENAGLFNFGVAGGGPRAGGGPPGGGPGGRGGTAPTLFYSRRIGLEGSREVPILAGGRLTGRMGAYNVGVINIQTAAETELDVPTTNFTVGRVRRDILRRSSIGAMVTHRSETPGHMGAASAFGFDASFAFYENLEFQAYLAQTRNPGVEGDDTSYRARVAYTGDRYGLVLDQLGVGANFDPAVGFVRRDDMHRSFGQVRFSPRPSTISAVRQFHFQAQAQYVENGRGSVETRQQEGQFQIDFESSDALQVQFTHGYEHLPFAFRVSDGVVIPSGGYDTDALRVSMTFGQQRPMSGNVAVERSQFYGGHRWSYGYSRGRINIHPQLSIEPGVSMNHVSTPFGDFTTQLVTSRVTYTATPLMFVSGLVQYNDSQGVLSTNVRLRWEYQPGSELFVVYSDGRTTTSAGFPALQNRSLVVKLNRLFRF